jgi:hypothetical protein
MRFLSCMLALCVLATGVAAQTDGGTKPQTETVVVTGNRNFDSVVSQFIDQHAATNRKTGQYMRDDIGPVCPATFGMPDAFNKFVTDRVLAVAKLIGAEAGVPGTCKPNVEILFTGEPGVVVKNLSDRTHGGILGSHYVHETRQLLEITHPVQAWYVTGTRMTTASIEPVTSVGGDGVVKPTDDKTPSVDDMYRKAPARISTGSLIPGRRVSSIMNVLIVADANKVAGQEIGPITDYIAMLALSEPRSLDDCNTLPSILDLMSDGCNGREKPKGLTDSDIAYLKGLYVADLGATTNLTQKESIESGMKGEIGKQP